MNRSSTEGKIARSDVGVIGRKGRDKSLRNAGNSYLRGLFFGLVVKICIYFGSFLEMGFRGQRLESLGCLVGWLDEEVGRCMMIGWEREKRKNGWIVRGG